MVVGIRDFFQGLLSFYTLSEKKSKATIIFSLVLIVVTMMITISTPYIFKSLLLSSEVPLGSLITHQLILFLYILLWSLGKINIFLREMIITKALEHWKSTLCLNYFEKILNAFGRNFLKPEVGEIVATVTKIQSEVPHFILTSLLLLIPSTLEIVIISVLLTIQYGVQLGFMALSLFFFVVFINTRSSKKLIKFQRSIKHSKKRIYHFCQDRFYNIQTIFNYGMQKKEYDAYARKIKRYAFFEIQNRIYAASANLIQTLIVLSLFTYVTLWSFYKVTKGALTTYDFILINALMINIINPIYAFSMVFRNIRRSTEDIKDLFGSKEPSDFSCGDEKVSLLDVPINQISLKNVAFSYIPGKTVLKNLTLSFPSGSKSAIVGYSGMGKSTLCSLISYLQPCEGHIFFGDRLREKISHQTLSQHLGIVSQTQGLFSESVLYNITYGCHHYNPYDLEEIIEGLNIRSLLAKKNNTKYLSANNNLSDGQRQKILIARVLLKSPSMIILDEATSHMDYQTESQVYNFLFEKMKNSTIIVVSHRLSSVVNFCDRMVVLYNQTIQAIGSHETMIKNNTIYQSLWEKHENNLVPNRRPTAKNTSVCEPS